jgi:hypothetical protein
MHGVGRSCPGRIGADEQGEAVGSLPLVTNEITSFELTEVITPGSYPA